MKSREKIVHLEATGIDVRIRRPGLLGMAHIRGGLPGTDSTAKADDVDAAIRLIEACCVDPKFSSAASPPQGHRSIDDIDPFDLESLCAEINGLLEPEAAAGAAIAPLSDGPAT